jgi:hypothetical protein
MSIAIEGKPAGSDDITVMGLNITINDRDGLHDVFQAEDGNFKTVNRLDIARDGGEKGLMVNEWGMLEKCINGSMIKEIEGDAVYRFTGKGALRQPLSFK